MKYKILILFVLLGQFLIPASLMAKERSLALTIIPPLMKDNMAPGDVKSSAIKIVNNNSVDIEVYTKVLDFKGKEDGGVEFINDIDSVNKNDLDKYFLSNWVTIEKGPIKIPAFKSKNISFLIEVPKNASPGGHYAAILVGTKPSDEKEGTVVKVSSYVSSLMLIKIAGDINEKGFIREFSTDKKLYRDSEVNFKVGFENLGNVHLHPRGNIIVYNIFGREKLNIPINESGNFGNVLPKNIRNWNLTWQSKSDVLLFDRFKAVLNLSYGDEAKQSEYREIHFWVVNAKSLLLVIGTLLFVLLFFILVVKFYIKQSVKNMKKQFGLSDKGKNINNSDEINSGQHNKIVDLRKNKK